MSTPSIFTYFKVHYVNLKLLQVHILVTYYSMQNISASYCIHHHLVYPLLPAARTPPAEGLMCAPAKQD